MCSHGCSTKLFICAGERVCATAADSVFFCSSLSRTHDQEAFSRLLHQSVSIGGSSKQGLRMSLSPTCWCTVSVLLCCHGFFVLSAWPRMQRTLPHTEILPSLSARCRTLLFFFAHAPTEHPLSNLGISWFTPMHSTMFACYPCSGYGCPEMSSLSSNTFLLKKVYHMNSFLCVFLMSTIRRSSTTKFRSPWSTYLRVDGMARSRLDLCETMPRQPSKTTLESRCLILVGFLISFAGVLTNCELGSLNFTI